MNATTDSATLSPATVTTLAKWISEIAETDGGDILGVTMGGMADGSGRAYALATTYQCGLEQEYRVSSPAPADATAWARVHNAWVLEVRVDDDKWLEIDREDVAVLASVTTAGA